jgi:hypothetical protein
LNGPYFVPRGLPAFALLAILLFHSRAKSADSESRLQNVWQLDFERSSRQGRIVSQTFTARLKPCPNKDSTTNYDTGSPGEANANF